MPRSRRDEALLITFAQIAQKDPEHETVEPVNGDRLIDPARVSKAEIKVPRTTRDQAKHSEDPKQVTNRHRRPGILGTSELAYDREGERDQQVKMFLHRQCPGADPDLADEILHECDFPNEPLGGDVRHGAEARDYD